MRLAASVIYLKSPRTLGAAASAILLSLILLAGALERLSAAETSAAAAVANTPDEIERFCGNIADAARDRRYANQAKELEALKAEVDERVKQLEAKRAEYEQWMGIRKAFIAQASETVVQIYGRMRPDAAAERLVELKGDLAAAILMKLDVKQSGQIMNEMERAAAARLTGIMASAARKDDPS